MNRLAEYKAAERALAMQFRAFEEMKADPELKKALEIESALEEFLTTNKLSKQALYDLLAYDVEPDRVATKKAVAAPAVAKSPTGKKRKKHAWPLRTYVNPHTQQEIKIRMATNATYTGWVAQYGKETVASWLTHTEQT